MPQSVKITIFVKKLIHQKQHHPSIGNKFTMPCTHIITNIIILHREPLKPEIPYIINKIDRIDRWNVQYTHLHHHCHCHCHTDTLRTCTRPNRPKQACHALHQPFTGKDDKWYNFAIKLFQHYPPCDYLNLQQNFVKCVCEFVQIHVRCECALSNILM